MGIKVPYTATNKCQRLYDNSGKSKRIEVKPGGLQDKSQPGLLSGLSHTTPKNNFFKNATGLEKANQNKGIDNNPQRGFTEGGNNHLEALRVIRGSKGNNSLFPQLSTALRGASLINLEPNSKDPGLAQTQEA